MVKKEDMIGVISVRQGQVASFERQEVRQVRSSSRQGRQENASKALEAIREAIGTGVKRRKGKEEDTTEEEEKRRGRRRRRIL